MAAPLPLHDLLDREAYRDRVADRLISAGRALQVVDTTRAELGPLLVEVEGLGRELRVLYESEEP